MRQSEKLRSRRAISSLILVLIALIIIGSLITAVVLWQLLITPGELISKEMDFDDFAVVAVGNAFEVEITQSSVYKINILADEYVHVTEFGKDEYTRELTFDYVRVVKEDGVLIVGLEPGYTYQSAHQFRPLTLQAEITMPVLTGLNFSGATHGTAEGFVSTNELALTLSGASHLDIEIIAGDIAIYLSGASYLNGEGSGANLIADVSGASHLDCSSLPVHDANLLLSGASWATVNLDGQLDADLSGASHLQYIGDPTLGGIQTSGGSIVEKQG
ncbi:MAG: DUF2807 domain-containing protein [Candidatus Bathyarchaeota archaeon]|nr:MAG: DUF2807 domain-containing protein [Candidatus Bathyarchaeota archaeon]